MSQDLKNLGLKLTMAIITLIFVKIPLDRLRDKYKQRDEKNSDIYDYINHIITILYTYILILFIALYFK